MEHKTDVFVCLQGNVPLSALQLAALTCMTLAVKVEQVGSLDPLTGWTCMVQGCGPGACVSSPRSMNSPLAPTYAPLIPLPVSICLLRLPQQCSADNLFQLAKDEGGKPFEVSRMRR